MPFSSPDRPLSSRFTFWALLLCALAIILLRALTFNEPFERDQTIYAVAAHEMLSGRPLYSDIWDIKPPAIYVTYAAAEVVGYGRGEIYLLGVSAAVLTLLGIYSATKTLSGDRFAALWASLFWVLVSSDMDLQANQPNTEVFINALLVWGLALLLRAYRGPKRELSPRELSKRDSPLIYCLCAGFCLGAATLFKQVAFLVPLFFAMGVLGQPPASLRALRGRFLAASAVLAPSFLLWALIFGYFEATGRGAIFRFTMLDYGRLYAGEGAKFVTARTSLWSRLMPTALFALLPLVLLLMQGLRAQTPLPRVWGILGLYALAVAGAIALPGQYLTHYYQLWIPVVVLAAGLSAALWRRHTPGNLPVAALFCTSLALLALQWRNWRLPLDEFSRQKYHTDFFVILPDAARAINARLLPGETFYQMGYDAGLYFETRRRPPVGVLSLGSPYLPPAPLWFQKRILADLEREKPEMAIVDAAFPQTPVTRYLKRNYFVLPHYAGPPQLVFMARRGGKLSARLGEKGG